MHRIYTEDVNRDAIADICAAHVAGFTLFPGLGYWRGSQQTYRENSICIELASATSEQVRAIAEEIKSANKQEAVLIAEFPVNTLLV